MTPSRLAAVLTAGLILALLIAATAPGSGVGMRVSTDAYGNEGNGDSVISSISADGRYVAFDSDASNLVAADGNGYADVFVKDTYTGAIRRVSTDLGSYEPVGDSYWPSISADGRFVAFMSLESNLVPGDTNEYFDIFVGDTHTGAISRVSTSSGGHEGNGDSGIPSISADGRYVAFDSDSSNLVTGDSNGASDTFVKDTQTGAISRVSTSSGGHEVNGDSGIPSISADGRFVAFSSKASNLVTGDTNGASDIFVKDTQTGAISRVSTNSSGNEGNDISQLASISADGRYVAFDSGSSNLVMGDSNGAPDIFVKDTQTGFTTRVSTSSFGYEGNSISLWPSISANSRYVAFQSYADNLVDGDHNGVWDTFVKDTQTGVTRRVSTNAGGSEGNGDSFMPALSANGLYVAFGSDASNLVSSDLNGFADIYLAGTSAACTTGKPDLFVEKADSYWGSYSDYMARLLSINLKVTNNGNADTYVIKVTGSTDTNDVTCVLCTASLGNLTAGSEHDFTLKSKVPAGVTVFSTVVHASAQDGCGTEYTYP